jgi:transcription antitermination factor NusG
LTAGYQIITETTFGHLPTAPPLCCWFAVQTRPRYEKKVGCEFESKAIETFLPLLSAKHQWSDRKQTVSSPLFPGYTFVRIPPTPEARISVLRTLGVINFVGARGIGTPIPDHEIEAIQTVLTQKIPFSLHPYMRVGQVVRIRGGGALDGICGVLTKINGDQSLVISVDLIQRSIAMRVTGYDIEPA